MNCETYQDLVAAHVDGVLSPLERQDAEAHVAACERCRHLLTEEQCFRAAFAARRLTVPVPAAVERRLQSALLMESTARRSWWAHLRAWLSTAPLRPRVAMGLAAAGLLLALLLPRLFSPQRGPDLLPQAVDYYQTVTAGRIVLAYATDDPHTLAAAFNGSGLSHPGH